MISFYVKTIAWAAHLVVLAAMVTCASEPRRPVALALSSDSTHVYVANRGSGTLSVFTTDDLTLAFETKIGDSLVDLTALPDGRLLAVDNGASELLLLRPTAEQVTVIARQKVSPDPQTVTVNSKGTLAVVASRWSRQLSLIELTTDNDDSLQQTTTIDLTFSPGRLLLVNEGQTLLAADYYRGRLGIVDMKQRQLTAVRKFYAHNIRGLQIDPSSGLLAVSHSMLNEHAHTVRNDVHWGVLMSNDLRWLSLEQVLDPEADFYNRGHMHPLGEPGMGGADPGGLAFGRDGTVVVTMTGTNMVAFGKEGDFGLHRLRVGRGPTAVVVCDSLGRALVANTLDDSITAIDLKAKKVLKTTSLGPARKLTLAERGEQLFHDGRLSHDGWMTCHTCHPGGHSNGDLNDNFSDKSFGAPKQVLSLLGVADTAPYAWNGQTKTLEQQIHNSHRQTMQGKEISDEQVTALAAYLRTLAPPPSVTALRGTQDEAAVARGKKLFAAHQCATCHQPPLYTSNKAYDVGIHDEQGNTHFNPPSLRGISQRGPFFHNGSADTLEDVFGEHGHQLDGDVLTPQQLHDLVAFLRSL